jgi:hypothetical protein
MAAPGAREIGPLLMLEFPGLIQGEIRPSGLLKWLNSLYRPAVPEQDRASIVPRVPSPACWGVAKW